MGTNPAFLRTLLILGRVSNLPTVWSNCLAGWLLADGGEAWRLAVLLLASSCLYIGGMYLNDAFDAGFDRQNRRARPIPSNHISEALVWRIGFGLIGVGLLALLPLGIRVTALGVLLSASIIIYDAVHKAVAFSPILMALCRFFLLLMAAAAGNAGLTGTALWTAIALAGWIVGLSYVARREAFLGPLAKWPLVALALPLVLAYLINDGPWRMAGLLFSLLLLAWAIYCLRFTFQQENRNLQRTVGGLLAGICLVDLLSISPLSPVVGLVFVALFLLSLFGQRFVPAT
ncbi:MAG TPA: UbiA family prenyltransferase [Candidatus Limnocylindria bacterium]|jgi:4-hydroxybenzoate polyprenyltransferase|nr:UbiA family prenyltransferase [Candidatus Limnocylindria bacterium]